MAVAALATSGGMALAHVSSSVLASTLQSIITTTISTQLTTPSSFATKTQPTLGLFQKWLLEKRIQQPMHVIVKETPPAKSNPQPAQLTARADAQLIPDGVPKAPVTNVASTIAKMSRLLKRSVININNSVMNNYGSGSSALIGSINYYGSSGGHAERIGVHTTKVTPQCKEKAFFVASSSASKVNDFPEQGYLVIALVASFILLELT